MRIGIPKEVMPGEKRIAALPDTVRKYIDMGFDVSVESSAGEGIMIGDEEFKIAGATISSDPESLYAQSDIILKVNPPSFNERIGKHEINLFRNDSILISLFYYSGSINFEILRRIRDKNLTAFAIDHLPRIPQVEKMDALSSMKKISGYKAVVMAVNQFPKFVTISKTPIGTFEPASFLIIGAGKLGLEAVLAAKRFSDDIKVMDVRRSACNKAQRLGAKIIGFNIPQEIAVDEKGRAKLLQEEWLEIERRIIEPHLEEADIVILSAMVECETSPLIVTEQMILNMKPGSVIIDASIHHGGNCEVTEPDRFIQRLGVYVYGEKDISSKMAVHASWLYANNMYYFVENLYKNSVNQPDLNGVIAKSSLIAYKSTILHGPTLRAMQELHYDSI